MTTHYESQDFYKKMLELQERLRRSEDERMKLEEKFNLLSQDFRNRRETCINKLRMRYIDFLEEQRLRDERNHQILGALDKIDGGLARMTARTDRLGILRKQYEAYLLRVYANRRSGGGTGDSGVGSHNEERSPKINISQTEKTPLLTQRVVTQNAGNSTSFIPQTNYAPSYNRPSNISQFNIPRYMPRQEIPQVHVTQAHGQGDNSTILQSQYLPQQFYGSQNLNISDNSIPKTQEFLSPSRSYPQQLSRDKFFGSSGQLAPNYVPVQHHRLHDISNLYTEDPRVPHAKDRSLARMRNFTGSLEGISSDLHLSSGRGNAIPAVNFSADLTDETFGPYRHSTPLPGYLDYSTRYSRDPSVYEPNAALRYGFTRSDLENVINRNEPILPKDYLHNPGTVKPASKLSSHLEDKERTPDTKSSGGSNGNELEQYINRIRSLHRDTDHSPEVLDIEQNTSGDLLNATLSDDGPEQLTLHSDDRIKSNDNKILSDDVKSVFALADNFVAETGKFGDESRFNSGSAKDGKVPSESIYSPQIYSKNVVVKPTSTDSNDSDPVALKANMTSDNFSISVTRDDILSRTASTSVNQIQDTSEIANRKFRPEITSPIANVETSRPDITGVTKLAQNNLVDSNKLSPNERGSNQTMSPPTQECLKILEKASYPDMEVIKVPTEVLSHGKQSLTKEHGSVPKEIEVHEDIEGDKVSLIQGEQTSEPVIDVVRELQPPSLQHYEKNVVEIHEGDEHKKDPNNRKVVLDDTPAPKDQENKDSGSNVAESLPEDSMAKKIHDVTDQKYLKAGQVGRQVSNDSANDMSEEVQYKDDAQPKYVLNSALHEYPAYDHQAEQSLGQDGDEISNNDQRFGQNLGQSNDPGTDEHIQLYDSNSDYKPDQQYEGDANQLYTQESDQQIAYDSNQHYGDHLYADETNVQYSTDANEQYATDPNVQYAADPNEQYAADPNGQYSADPNEQYSADSDARYAADPNEQYAADPNGQYSADPNEQYSADSNAQYAADPNEKYAIDSNEQYATDTNEQYATGPNEQYADDPNEQYAAGQNEEYTADPNAQYDYYQNQPYQTDPNATYGNAQDEQYGYIADQGYQHDPNQQYEHDPNQQYEHKPNQQYEHDPNQQYEHDPNQQYEHDPNQQYEHDPNQQYEHDSNQQYEQDLNASSAQYPNQEYEEDEYGQNQGAEAVGYEQPEQVGNQQFENDSQQDNAGRNPELQYSDEDYRTATAAEHSEIRAATGDSYIEELSNPDDIRAQQYSADGKKKNKDVISALLESDTESTIERNPSNKSESDFDFN